MTPHRIFIGWDPREAEAAEVLKHTLLKYSSAPLDIRFLVRRTLERQHGFRLFDRGGSTEFSFTRFAVPWLCRYEGLALFMDSDMLVFGDIAELFALPMSGLALRCTQHDWEPTTDRKMDGQPQVAYARKLWSSCMLLNCPMLRAWTKEAVECWHGGALHQFFKVPDDQIGCIDLNWNEVEFYKHGQTKCLHFTEWNPWMNPGVHPDERLWLEARDEWKRSPLS